MLKDFKTFVMSKVSLSCIKSSRDEVSYAHYITVSAIFFVEFTVIKKIFLTANPT